MTRRWNSRCAPLALAGLCSLACGAQDGHLEGNGIEMQGSSGSDDGDCNPMDPACTSASDDGATGNGEDPGEDGQCDPNVDPMCGGGETDGGSSGGCDPADPMCAGETGACDPNVDPSCAGTSSDSGGDGNCNPMIDPTCTPGSTTGDPATSGDDSNCNPMIDPTCDPTGGSTDTGNATTGCSPMDPGC